MIMGFTTYISVLGRKERTKLPLAAGYNLPDDIYEHIPEPIMNETGYMEFLQQCLAHGAEAIAQFRHFRNKYAADLDNEYL